jgi:hypothetical protein
MKIKKKSDQPTPKSVARPSREETKREEEIEIASFGTVAAINLEAEQRAATF